MDTLREMHENLNQKKWEQKIAQVLGLDPQYAIIIEETYEAFSRDMERETGYPWKSIYVEHLSKLLVNLDPNSYLNEENGGKISPLLERLRNSRVIGSDISPDSYDPKLLPYLTNYELNDNSHEIREEIQLRKNQEIQIKYSEDYTCSKCKERKTKEYRLQARSGDEGYTYKAECINCGFIWRTS